MGKSLGIVIKKGLQVILFLSISLIYLYIGYHNKEYVFSFDSYSFILNQGVDEIEYIDTVSDVSSVFNTESRWSSSVFVVLVLSVLSSLLVWIYFWKKRYFIISLLYYLVLMFLCVSYVVFFSLLSNSEIGYQFARFVKDNFIHTPFVFVILVASLKVFKV